MPRNARRSVAASLLAMGLLGASAGPVAVRAETATVIARGSVALQNVFAGQPNPESVAYVRGGCTGSRNDGQFAAFIDLRGYQGKTLRFVGEGTTTPPGSVIWTLLRGVDCASFTFQGPIDGVHEPASFTWENTSPFLYVRRAIQPESPGLDGRFRVEVLNP
jgi:hypothetical protein